MRNRAEHYKWRWSWGNNLDVDQKTGLTELVGNHDGTSSVNCHLPFSPISWARLESILCLSLPTYPGACTLKYDGWGECAHKPYSFNRAWLHLHLQHYQGVSGRQISVLSLTWPPLWTNADRCRAASAPFSVLFLQPVLKHMSLSKSLCR